MAFDLSSIDREVHRNLQFDPIFEQADRYSAINDTILDIVSTTEFQSDPWTATTEAGKAEYALPDGTIKVVEVTWDGYPLEAMTLYQWNTSGAEKYQRQGIPRRYWVRNNKFINLYPYPQDAQTIQVYIVQKPDDLVNPTDEPVLPSYALKAIVEGACFRLLQNETEQRDQAQDFERKYQRSLGKLNQGLNRNKRGKVRQVVLY